jgi:hypothetical protein
LLVFEQESTGGIRLHHDSHRFGLICTSSSLINTSRDFLLNSSREAALQSSPSSHRNPNPPPLEPIR